MATPVSFNLASSKVEPKTGNYSYSKDRKRDLKLSNDTAKQAYDDFKDKYSYESKVQDFNLTGMTEKIEEVIEEVSGQVESDIHIFDEVDETPTSQNENNNSNTPTSSPNLPNLKNGNVIDASEPLYTTEGYTNLSDEELEFLAKVAFREQRSIEGAKVSLSTMANQYEANKAKYDDVEDYVRQSGWYGTGGGSFNDAFYKEYTSSTKAELQKAAKDVMIDGNRYVPSTTDNHDCLSDISRVETNGKTINKNDKSSYVPGETKIYNVYGAIFVFQGFAPNGGDPYGETVGQWKQ